MPTPTKLVVEHRLINIKKFAERLELPEGQLVAEACDRLAADGWEVCASVWTSEHLLFRRTVTAPVDPEADPTPGFTYDLQIPMTMKEANALTAVMDLVDTDNLDEEDQKHYRWIMNRVGRAWIEEVERRKAVTDDKS